MAIQAIHVRNQIKGHVKEIIRGDVLSEVDVQTPWGIFTSIITTRSVDELQLKAGSDVVALVNPTEVLIVKSSALVAPSRSPKPALAIEEPRASNTLIDTANRFHTKFRSQTPTPQTLGTLPGFYRLPDVVRFCALSRSTIYRRVAEGKFPAPVHLGGRASGWSRAALQQWIENPEGFRVAPAQPRPNGT
jgi:molybdopterin-binding protein